MPNKTQIIALSGGLDLKTPISQLKPGRLTVVKNYEQKITGGYRRVPGYTKFDTNAVPGEGPIRGVWYYNGKVYAFRNATGGVTCEMHESSGSGWTAKKTGLTPNGNYRFVNYDFAGTQKMYGASGVHKAFEWNGTTWSDLTTGMAVDTPTHIIGHRKHLFLSFGRSVQHSSIGDPTNWTPITGASEIATADTITGFMQLQGGVLGIFSKDAAHILYGSSSSDWNLQSFTEHGNNMGARADSLQQLGTRALYMGDNGVITLQASEVFGDFVDATLTYLIQSKIPSYKTSITASVVNQERSQYILYAGSTFLIITLAGEKVVGITEGEYPVAVRCIARSEDVNGNEQFHFGSDDGFIYLIGGDYFDGIFPNAYFRVAYHHLGSPTQLKRFMKVVLGINTNGEPGTITVQPAFDLDDPGVPTGSAIEMDAGGGGGTWDEGDWDTAEWTGVDNITGDAYIQGVGRYITLTVSSAAGDHEIDDLTYIYQPLRLMR